MFSAKQLAESLLIQATPEVINTFNTLLNVQKYLIQVYFSHRIEKWILQFRQAYTMTRYLESLHLDHQM